MLSLWGDAIIRVQHYPSDQTTASQKPKSINRKNAPLRVSTAIKHNNGTKSIISKLSLNGFDLVELEPKPVHRRQIPIDPARAESL
jgi:hypothetical protein